MAIGPRLEFRQSQSLVMTPQLRQAIKLLQFSNMEVSAFVEEELERNPLLERDERSEGFEERPDPSLPSPPPEGADTAELVSSATIPDEAAAPLDADHAATYDSDSFGAPGAGGSHSFEADERDIGETIAATTSLREHLGEQLRLSFPDPRDRLIGAHLIALLDPAGRVSVEDAALAEALGTEIARVAAVRARMMRFDPTGLFARDLRECLAAQLAERNRLDPAMATLLDHLELLARRDLRQLMTLCGVDSEDLQDMIAEIRALNPKPGTAFETMPTMPVIPDVMMRAAPNGEWLLEMNPETLPRVLVNSGFAAKLNVRAQRDERAFIAEKLSSANWLVKSLQQRAQTILKVSGEIVRRQDGFFRHGVAHLRPLILRDVAEEVEMHESTVSRVTANKYIATPRGTFELKYFFTTALSGTAGESHSAEAVRHRIRTLIGAETSADILSDDAIVLLLRKEGVDIARRTVAKYREALRIPSSVQRKREKAISA